MKVSGTVAGQRLGNYLIQEPLGRGGMARVYKGLDTMLKRPVAVKVIEEGLRTSDTYARRFEREAQAVANLRHPNIVNVFYFGIEGNLYYLVMEYIDGTDLDAILRNYDQSGELMPYADVMRVLEATAAALDYAHGQGVIHRDVKPSNIMLERSGRPVLTDFGLALKVSEGTVGDTFGTPHYISPEQARNSAAAVPQSDLYSLGVVAYELLTGTLPFDDPSPTALAMQHLMAAVPSPRVFNPRLSVEIETVLYTVLAKTPEERYSTGGEFCAALRRGLEATLRLSGTSSSDLPLPPAGIEVPPPRRLSMQTALDKVDQELAMQQAKGQSLTRSADTAQVLTDTWRKVNSSNWLPYVVATSLVVVVLIILATVLGGGAGEQGAVATNAIEPTQIAALASTTEVTDEPTPLSSDTLSVTPTDTPIPPTDTTLPTATSVPPMNTPEPPTATPTSTPVPPTVTPVPPTAEPPTPIPPSPTPAPIVRFSADSELLIVGECTVLRWYTQNIDSVYIDGQPTIGESSQQVCPSQTTTYGLLVRFRDGSEQTYSLTIHTSAPPTAEPITPTDPPPGPTPAPSDWLPISFVYNANGFWWLNGASRSISAQPIRFERIGGGQSFSGSRWAFWTMEPGRCMEIRFADVSNPQRPNGCRPNAFFTPTRSQGVDFWTGSGQFRVLWNGTEIAVCEIMAGQCSAFVPPS